MRGVRKFSWEEPQKISYLETYITEAQNFSEQIKTKYKRGLSKKNIDEFRDFTNSSYMKLEDLLFRAFSAGELERPEYDEISGVLDKGKHKCEEKVSVIYGV